MGELYLSCNHLWEEEKLPTSLWWHSWDDGEFVHCLGSLCRPCRSIYELCSGPETCIETIYVIDDTKIMTADIFADWIRE